MRRSEAASLLRSASKSVSQFLPAAAPDCWNFKLAGPDRRMKSVRLQHFRAGHGWPGVIDVDRDGADAWAMRQVARGGEAVRFAIDHQFDIALGPAHDVLAAIGVGVSEAELAEQR